MRPVLEWCLHFQYVISFILQVSMEELFLQKIQLNWNEQFIIIDHSTLYKNCICFHDVLLGMIFSKD